MPDYRVNSFEADGQIGLTRNVSDVDEKQVIAWCQGMMGSYFEPGTYPVAEVWDGDRLIGQLRLKTRTTPIR